MSGTQIYLAPFQGITTYTFREVYTKHFVGVHKLFTPFYTGIQKTKSLSKRSVELNYTNQNGIEVIPQILSKDAEEIIRFVNYCSDKGYREVNWNLGCPYPRVANKKRGSGILPYPEMVDAILSEVIPSIDIDFSIKCRLGYFSDKEILRLVEVYNIHRVSEVTIHARIGKQLYSGEVNLDAFREALELMEVPVVYNGDIYNSVDFRHLSHIFPQIRSWMIGRGLLVDPFLPARVLDLDLPDPDHEKEIIFHFIMDLYLAYRKLTNDRLQSISVMKEVWSFLSYSFSDPHKIFNLVKKTKSFDDYEYAVSRVFKDFSWHGSEADLFRKGLSQV